MTDYYTQRIQSDGYLRSRRHKAWLLYQIIGSQLRRSDVILDIGSGTGLIKYELELMSDKRIIGLEPDMSFIRYSSDMVVGNGTVLPFRDESVDMAILNHVYEHVAGLDSLLTEVRRVLHPNGCVWLVAWNKWYPIEPHYGLPLLGMLPGWLANLYLRLVKRGTCYNIRLMGYNGLYRKLCRYFVCADYTRSVIYGIANGFITTNKPVWNWLCSRYRGGWDMFMPQWFFYLTKRRYV